MIEFDEKGNKKKGIIKGTITVKGKSKPLGKYPERQRR